MLKLKESALTTIINCILENGNVICHIDGARYVMKKVFRDLGIELRATKYNYFTVRLDRTYNDIR